MVGAGEDVVAAEFEHGDEAAPSAPLAEVDGQRLDAHVPDIETDGADLGGALAAHAACGPVLSYRHQRHVGDDLMDDHVVVQGEVPYVTAGRRGEHGLGDQLAVRAGGGLLGAAEAQRADADLPGFALEGRRADVAAEVGADGRGLGGQGRRFDVGQIDPAGCGEVADRQFQPRGDGGLVHVELDH
ncbi:hypothetical protein ABZW44_06630 [Streptomyces mirabilis]|uniref:hypothetical protein n=1 Tax=Streptomyces mirabilis TaxID=68239 RepID=UPI0033AF63E6